MVFARGSMVGGRTVLLVCPRTPYVRNTMSIDPTDSSAADALAILDSLDAFVYSKDLDGNYVYANRAVQSLFGASLDGIRGHDDSQFFDLEQSNELRVNDLKVIADGVTVRREEHDIVKETGEQRVYLTTKSPMRNASGELVGMCGISLDITPRG